MNIKQPINILYFVCLNLINLNCQNVDVSNNDSNKMAETKKMAGEKMAANLTSVFIDKFTRANEHSVKKDLSGRSKRQSDNKTTQSQKNIVHYTTTPMSQKNIVHYTTTPMSQREKKIEHFPIKDVDLDLYDYDDDDDDEQDDVIDKNATELGMYLGSPCESTCNNKLLHVICDSGTQTCECDPKYPVKVGMKLGCAKPKQLGDQCFYAQTCIYNDPNSICTQINHNAICQCKPGFHTVDIQRGVKRMFCSEDLVVLTTDVPTLLGVATGLAIFSGLICFVLKLFSGRRYPRHYANGIPLTVHHHRPSSRSSSRRSNPNLSHGYSTRSKGVFVPASRAGAARAAAILLIPCHLQASRTSDVDVEGGVDDSSNAKETSPTGSRRPSLSSVQSTASSQRSYSTRRFEQEREQKEHRVAMRAARDEASRMTQPTPSPMSTDELLGIFNKSEVEDPLGFSSSVLSVKSAVSPAQERAPTPTEFVQLNSATLRH